MTFTVAKLTFKTGNVTQVHVTKYNLCGLKNLQYYLYFIKLKLCIMKESLLFSDSDHSLSNGFILCSYGGQEIGQGRV